MDLKGFEAPLFFPDGGSISNLKDKLLSEEFAGVISIGVPSERMRGELPLVGIPVVTAAFDSPDFLYCVATDDYTGGWMAGRHILSKGHRKIIILRGNNFRDPAFLRRENGFRGAADACSEKTELLRIIPDFIEQANRDRFFEFLKKGFTAVFLTSDMIMERLLPILNEAGVGVPDDISLMGYDNLINNRDISGIPIDSVDQPWREIASEACRLVFSAVSGKIKGERVFIRPRIVKKNTVTENKKME
jgi:LacI family transcriptional regulator